MIMYCMFLLLLEFEGLYWAEQKTRAQQKQRDNAILVSRDTATYISEVYMHIIRAWV